MRLRSRPSKAAQLRLEDNGSPSHIKTNMARSRRTETHITRSVTNVENGAIFCTSVPDREENPKEKKKQEGEGTRTPAKFQRTHLNIDLILHQLFGKREISYLDLGASNHMTPDRFVDFAPAMGHIRIGKGHLELKGKGMIIVKMAEPCGGWTFSLSNAL